MIKDQGKLIIKFGPRGNGKSVSDVADGLESMRHEEYNAFNYDITLPPDVNPKYYIRFSNLEELIHREYVRIHLDEAQWSFSNRGWENMAPETRQFVCELRHAKCALICLVQIFTDIDVTFRNQSDFVFSMHRLPFGFVLSQNWTRKSLDPNEQPPFVREGIIWAALNPARWFRLTKEVKRAYDTHVRFMVDSPLTKDEKRQLAQKNIKKIIQLPPAPSPSV